MFRNFNEMEEYVVSGHRAKIVALCGAHDQPALEAVADARKRGVVAGAYLIGDSKRIRCTLKEIGEQEEYYTVIEETDETLSSRMAIKLVREGNADIPMKGLVQTASFLRAVLDKENGILPKGKLLNQCMVFEDPVKERLTFAGDCAMNIYPGFEEKKKIIENCVALAESCGYEVPKVAALSVLEKVNPKITSSVEAGQLAELDWKGRCIVEGPFALDNAVDSEAAKHKGVAGQVAGNADILLMSGLDMGNAFYKSLHFYAHFKIASALCGTDYPVVMTSRTDTPETKYLSILIAILQADAVKASKAA